MREKAPRESVIRLPFLLLKLALEHRAWVCVAKWASHFLPLPVVTGSEPPAEGPLLENRWQGRVQENDHFLWGLAPGRKEGELAAPYGSSPTVFVFFFKLFTPDMNS